jgi:hypothetical protein
MPLHVGVLSIWEDPIGGGKNRNSSLLILEKQVDLVGVLSPSRGLVSSLAKPLPRRIVNGKREISKAQARKLGEFFNVSPSVFI